MVLSVRFVRKMSPDDPLMAEEVTGSQDFSCGREKAPSLIRVEKRLGKGLS